ncbi:NAD(P)H-dependent flavin oxidoreductase [Cytobacillus purgationiresistens]|uniref:Probable nitronate monooxygenase n=1 Tax=Cytobacillus purgationiresistens TaxID=863449 RepID=A0ABU0AG53_9BACI|nr:nitronate monooxygenase [Cytobacillus purgationiresistens]MDQ0269767.1 nitronate monooxygenase [Cytobacillus purgationiresistens]
MKNNNFESMKESLSLPVMVAPMFLISNPAFVINSCKSGVVGTFPALNARSEEILQEWMSQINTELTEFNNENPDKKAAPWGINFITHRSNKRYIEDLKLIEQYEPPIVITSLGDPGPVAEIVHKYGGMVISDVINIKFAKKALEKGADGLVLVTSGAGGHAGTYNPIAFIHEVREFFDGPLMLAGGISKGEDILAAEILGADIAYMGTRFITAKESLAQNEYKQMIIDSGIDDIIYTDAFSGVNANYLIPSIINSGLDPANLVKKEINFGELNNKVKAWRDVWGAGQGIGSIHEVQSIEEITAELKQQYNQARESIVARHQKIPR